MKIPNTPPMSPSARPSVAADGVPASASVGAALAFLRSFCTLAGPFTVIRYKLEPVNFPYSFKQPSNLQGFFMSYSGLISRNADSPFASIRSGNVRASCSDVSPQLSAELSDTEPMDISPPSSPFPRVAPCNPPAVLSVPAVGEAPYRDLNPPCASGLVPQTRGVTGFQTRKTSCFSHISSS